MLSRAWLWVIDLFGFCETEGKVIKKKSLEAGKRKGVVKGVKEKGKGGGIMGESRVGNRRVEEIKREEGCECECEDCCEKEEGMEKLKEKKEEWWESWVEV